MRKAKGWLFGLGLAAALGFGGTQAVAAPGPGGADAAARKCNPTSCNASCQAQGGISGRCTDAGLCACFY